MQRVAEGRRDYRRKLRQNDSGQNQAVGKEGLKISGVAGRQFRPAANGHRRYHAISETAGTAASLVEQPGGQYSVGGQKGFGIREDLPGDGVGGRIKRPAQKFRPGNAAGVAVFLRERPALEFLMRRRTGDDGLDEKVGVEMNHAESSGHQRLASRTDVIHSAAPAASRWRCFCSASKA